jgi:Putative Actinobacterial Holin-X, holin superfamily III
MADNQLTPGDRVSIEARETDWASLLGRAVDDLTRIMHSELRLLSLSMKSALDEEVDRLLALVGTGILMIGGVICALATIILFLHEFVMLPWWQSFGITALVLFVVAIALRAFAARRPNPPAIT